jgi:hypothetical protein
MFPPVVCYPACLMLSRYNRPPLNYILEASTHKQYFFTNVLYGDQVRLSACNLPALDRFSSNPIWKTFTKNCWEIPIFNCGEPS